MTIAILPINVFNIVTMATDVGYVSSIFDFNEIGQFVRFYLPMTNTLKGNGIKT